MYILYTHNLADPRVPKKQTKTLLNKSQITSLTNESYNVICMLRFFHIKTTILFHTQLHQFKNFSSIYTGCGNKKDPTAQNA